MFPYELAVVGVEDWREDRRRKTKEEVILVDPESLKIILLTMNTQFYKNTYFLLFFHGIMLKNL